MKYTARQGVILKRVCGEYLLVATGEAAECCPLAMTLNGGAAYYWILIEQGKSFEQMLESAAEVSRKNPEELRNGLLTFLRELENRNYIVKEEI